METPVEPHFVDLVRAAFRKVPRATAADRQC